MNSHVSPLPACRFTLALACAVVGAAQGTPLLAQSPRTQALSGDYRLLEGGVFQPDSAYLLIPLPREGGAGMLVRLEHDQGADLDIAVYDSNPDSTGADPICESLDVGTSDECRLIFAAADAEYWLEIIGIEAPTPISYRVMLRPLAGPILEGTALFAGDAKSISGSASAVASLVHLSSGDSRAAEALFSIPPGQARYLSLTSSRDAAPLTIRLFDREGHLTLVSDSAPGFLQVPLPATDDTVYVLAGLAGRMSRPGRTAAELALSTDPLPEPLILGAEPKTVSGTDARTFSLHLLEGWAAVASLTGAGAILTAVADGETATVTEAYGGERRLVHLGGAFPGSSHLLRGAERARRYSLSVRSAASGYGSDWTLTVSAQPAGGPALIRFSPERATAVRAEDILKGNEVKAKIGPDGLAVFWLPVPPDLAAVAQPQGKAGEMSSPPRFGATLSDAAAPYDLAVASDVGRIHSIAQGRVWWDWPPGSRGIYVVAFPRPGSAPLAEGADLRIRVSSPYAR